MSEIGSSPEVFGAPVFVGKKLSEKDKSTVISKVTEREDVSRQFYDYLSSREEAEKLDIDRAKKFVELETGYTVDCNVYIVGEKNWGRVVADKRRHDPNWDGTAFYEPSTNSVVAKLDSDRPAVTNEAVVAHELVHSSGARFKGMNVGETGTRLQSERIGLRVGESGELLEELLPSAIQVKYSTKFSGEVETQIASKCLKKDIRSIEDMKNYSVKYPGNSQEENVDLPTNYLRINNHNLDANENNVAAYLLDIMIEKAYSKDVDLRSLMIEARRDPTKIKDLAMGVDKVFGSGSYQKLRAAKYADKDIVPLIRHFKSVT